MQLRKLAFVPFLFAASLLAQVSYSTISGTVTDANSNPLANATIVATLVNVAGIPVSGPVTPNGQPYNGSPVYGTLDATGHFSLNLVPNGILSRPSNTQWRIQISAPQDPAILTFSGSWNVRYQFTVTGNQDLSSQISALVTTPVAFFNTKTGQSTLTGQSYAGVTPDGGFGINVRGAVASASINGAVNATAYAGGSNSGGIIEAYATLPSTGGIITLGANVTITTPQTLTLTKPLVFNQNGFTISCANSSGTCLYIDASSLGRNAFAWRDFNIDGTSAGAGATGVYIKKALSAKIGPGMIKNFEAIGTTGVVFDFVEDSNIDLTLEQDYNGAVLTDATNNNNLLLRLNDGGTEYLGTCTTAQNVGGVALTLSNGSSGNTFNGLVQSNCGTQTIVFDATLATVSLNTFSGFDFENNGDGSAGKLFTFITSATNGIYGTSIKASSFNSGPNTTGLTMFDASGPGTVQGLTLQGNTGAGFTKFTSGFTSRSAGVTTITDFTGTDALATKAIPYGGTAFYSSPGYSTLGWLLYQTGSNFYIRDTVNGQMAFHCNPGAPGSCTADFPINGTISNATVAAGLTGTPNISVGTINAAGSITLATNQSLYGSGTAGITTGASGFLDPQGGGYQPTGWRLYPTGGNMYLRDTVNSQMAWQCNPNATAPPCTFYGGITALNGLVISTVKSAKSLATDSNGTVTPATLAGVGAGLTTGPTAGTTVGHIVTYADASGTIQDSGTALTSLPTVICTGTITLSTAAIASGAKFDNTATCTGLLTTDDLRVSFNSDPTAVTGYAVSTSGQLTLYPWPAAGVIHVTQGNSTSSSITPGALTLNYHVLRY